MLNINNMSSFEVLKEGFFTTITANNIVTRDGKKVKPLILDSSFATYDENTGVLTIPQPGNTLNTDSLLEGTTNLYFTE